MTSSEQLAADAMPVGRLPPPWRRAAIWLAVALPYVALVVLAMPPEFDVAAALADRRFLIEQLAALATALLAAFAAFASVVPGIDRRVLLLPLVPLAIWLASLGEGCVQDWIRLGPDGLADSCRLGLPAAGIVDRHCPRRCHGGDAAARGAAAAAHDARRSARSRSARSAISACVCSTSATPASW